MVSHAWFGWLTKKWDQFDKENDIFSLNLVISHIPTKSNIFHIVSKCRQKKSSLRIVSNRCSSTPESRYFSEIGNKVSESRWICLVFTDMHFWHYFSNVIFHNKEIFKFSFNNKMPFCITSHRHVGELLNSLIVNVKN